MNMTHYLSIGPKAIILIVTIALVSLVLSLIALVDIVRSAFRETNDKLIWVLIVLFLNLIGALLYFSVGTRQKVRD